METKRVFSTKKFIEDCKKSGDDAEDIIHSLMSWAIDCDGLTSEKMFKKGLLSHEDWEIEVKVRTKKNGNS